MSEDKALRVPAKGVYAAIVLCVVTVCALALLVSPLVGVWALTFMLCVYGLGQLFLPRGILPQVRSRFFDVTCCFVLAAGLAFFAQWAGTAQIV